MKNVRVPEVSRREFTTQLKHQASELGFVLSGVTAAAAPARLEQFHRWLDAGYAGQMHYLETRREAYGHPRHVLEGCRSIVMLAVPYDGSPAETIGAGEGHAKIARYASGPGDYHDVLHQRLKTLKAWVLQSFPEALVRGVVDTAPLLEREFAEAAGMGWIGKNTLLLNRQWGSYFFLAALLTDLDLTLDPPYEKGFCGTCTACLQACPTDAFPEPFVLDANRCISYLTIEHRDHISLNLRDQMGDWIFGCDICQEVCPWNRKPRATDPAFVPIEESMPVLDILAMSDDDFRERFRRRPMWRSRRRGLLRNAILVAASQPVPEADPALRKLLHDPEPLIRVAAAWALSRIRGDGWQDHVLEAAAVEADPSVRREMQGVLGARPGSDHTDE